MSYWWGTRRDWWEISPSFCTLKGALKKLFGNRAAEITICLLPLEQKFFLLRVIQLLCNCTKINE